MTESRQRRGHAGRWCRRPVASSAETLQPPLPAARAAAGRGCLPRARRPSSALSLVLGRLPSRRGACEACRRSPGCSGKSPGQEPSPRRSRSPRAAAPWRRCRSCIAPSRLGLHRPGETTGPGAARWETPVNRRRAGQAMLPRCRLGNGTAPRRHPALPGRAGSPPPCPSTAGGRPMRGRVRAPVNRRRGPTPMQRRGRRPLEGRLSARSRPSRGVQRWG